MGRPLASAEDIRPYEDSDLDAIVDLSLRAWAPVFESMRQVLGETIFARLHQPDWTTVQEEAVRATCVSAERDVFVSVVHGLPAGFVAVALNAFHERMGLVDMIAVDPTHQGRGIATRLMEHAVQHMRLRGMDIAAVGTGGDRGHGPARRLYESLGYTALPGVRYLKILD